VASKLQWIENIVYLRVSVIKSNEAVTTNKRENCAFFSLKIYDNQTLFCDNKEAYALLREIIGIGRKLSYCSKCDYKLITGKSTNEKKASTCLRDSWKAKMTCLSFCYSFNWSNRCAVTIISNSVLFPQCLFVLSHRTARNFYASAILLGLITWGSMSFLLVLAIDFLFILLSRIKLSFALKC